MTPRRRGIAGDIVVRPARRAPLPSPPLPPSPIAVAPPPPRTSPRHQSRPPRRHRWLDLLQYPLIAILALISAYSSTAGQAFVLVYAVLALILRRGSRFTFGLALFVLVTIPLFEALKQSGIAQNAAIYTFELLVVGTAQAVYELRKTDKTAK
jgi:hypothetical protein